MPSWDRTPSYRYDEYDGDVDVAMSYDNTSSHDDIPSYRYDDIPSYPHNIPSWDRTPSHQYDGCDVIIHHHVMIYLHIDMMVIIISTIHHCEI